MSAAAPISRFVDAQGMSLHLLEWAAPDTDDRPPLLLLHGFLDLAWSWAWFVENLGRSRRVLAPDFRGHGDSGRTPPGTWYHFVDYLGDLHEVMEAEGLARVDLMGHSMGGVAAQYFTGAFPERVRKLVLVEGMGPKHTPVDQAPERVRTWVLTRGSFRRREPRDLGSLEQAAGRLRHHNPGLSPERAAWLVERSTRRDERGHLVWKHDPFHLTRSPIPYTEDFHAAFSARIRSPTLIVNAERTQERNRKEWQRREAHIPEARTVTLPCCGHMVHHDAPEALAAVVESFLSEGP
jgi:pimeloyl-ACP methyl ester carboxylesterase